MKPTIIKGPLPSQAVEAYRKAHRGHLPGDRSEVELRIEYLRLMQAHKRDFETLLEMHVRVLTDAQDAKRWRAYRAHLAENAKIKPAALDEAADRCIVATDGGNDG